MFIETQRKNPKQLIRFGMVSLALMLMWPRFLPLTGGLSPDVIDAVRGFFLGAALALLMLGASLGAFRRGGVKPPVA